MLSLERLEDERSDENVDDTGDDEDDMRGEGSGETRFSPRPTRETLREKRKESGRAAHLWKSGPAVRDLSCRKDESSRRIVSASGRFARIP